MKTTDFDYYLPEELIAQTPKEPRDSSRLLVYDSKTDTIHHEIFRDIVKYLKKGDVLVRNNTRVLPARLYGYTKNGARVEVLLLKRLDLKRWEVLVKPGKKARTGASLTFSEELSLTVESVNEDGGTRIVEFTFNGVFEDIISRLGEMPLPPYIHEKLENKERYQTVYSKIDGSAAAPTAGLHFTEELLSKIKDMGVTVADVLLHVGLGTFRPVKEDDIENHDMHSEYYEIPSETAEIVNKAKREGRRIIAVGTTSVRTLETIADENGFIRAAKGETKIFLYPPYKFKCVDGLITNFHLPKSTLIMLVSCLTGREKILDIYKTAVEEKYRFFSFGDACLFL